MINLAYLYLYAPLHTGGTTQEGNLLGIARESHTDLPYIPSSSIRGRLRASTKGSIKTDLFGTELDDGVELTQGSIWIGDASLLWIPVPSLSHGVVWVSCPMLFKRWQRLAGTKLPIPADYASNLRGTSVYLKDAIISQNSLKPWENWQACLGSHPDTRGITSVLLMPDKHFATLVQMSLWRQVKVKLNAHKTVEGGFRYEEAIPPDTLMVFSWGTTAQANGSSTQSKQAFLDLLSTSEILQIGGQESLGRGFTKLFVPPHN